jgi:hypothetical protein
MVPAGVMTAGLVSPGLNRMLHTNASENHLRAWVIKRKISSSTMSVDGRLARDVMLGLLKTCRKLRLSFFAYLGDRLGLKGISREFRPSPFSGPE